MGSDEILLASLWPALVGSIAWGGPLVYVRKPTKLLCLSIMFKRCMPLLLLVTTALALQSQVSSKSKDYARLLDASSIIEFLKAVPPDR